MTRGRVGCPWRRPSDRVSRVWKTPENTEHDQAEGQKDGEPGPSPCSGASDGAGPPRTTHAGIVVSSLNGSVGARSDAECERRSKRLTVASRKGEHLVGC